MDSSSASNNKRQKDHRPQPKQKKARRHDENRASAVAPSSQASKNMKRKAKKETIKKPSNSKAKGRGSSSSSSSKRAKKPVGGNTPSVKVAPAKEKVAVKAAHPTPAAAKNAAPLANTPSHHRTRYVGVTFHPGHLKYEARTDRGCNLGSYDLACDAALACDVAHRIAGDDGPDYDQSRRGMLISNDVEKIKYALNWLDLANDKQGGQKSKDEETAVNFTTPTSYRQARIKENADYIARNARRPPFTVKNVPSEEELKKQIRTEILNLARDYVESRTAEQEGRDVSDQQGSHNNPSTSKSRGGKDWGGAGGAPSARQERDKKEKAGSFVVKKDTSVPEETAVAAPTDDNNESEADRLEEVEALLFLRKGGNQRGAAADANRQGAQASEAPAALPRKTQERKEEVLSQNTQNSTNLGGNGDPREKHAKVCHSAARSQSSDEGYDKKPAMKSPEEKNVMFPIRNKSSALEDVSLLNQLQLNQQSLNKWKKASIAEAAEKAPPEQKNASRENSMPAKRELSPNQPRSQFNQLQLQQQQALENLRAAAAGSSSNGTENGGGLTGLQQQQALENLRAATAGSSFSGTGNTGGLTSVQQQQALETLRAAAAGSSMNGAENGGGLTSAQQQQALENLRAAAADSSLNGAGNNGGLTGLQQQQALENLRAVAAGSSMNAVGNNGGLAALQQQHALDNLRAAAAGSSMNATGNNGGLAGGSLSPQNQKRSALEQVLRLAGQHSDMSNHGQINEAAARHIMQGMQSREGAAQMEAASMMAASGDGWQGRQDLRSLGGHAGMPREDHELGEDAQAMLQRKLASEAKKASLAHEPSGLVQEARAEPRSEGGRPHEQGGRRSASATMAYGDTPLVAESANLKRGGGEDVARAMYPQDGKGNLVPNNIASSAHVPSPRPSSALLQPPHTMQHGQAPVDEGLPEGMDGQTIIQMMLKKKMDELNMQAREQGLPDDVNEQTIIQSLMLKKQMDEMKMNKQTLEQKIQDYHEAKGDIVNPHQPQRPVSSPSYMDPEQMSRNIALQSLLSQEGGGRFGTNVDGAQEQSLAGQQPSDLARQMAIQNLLAANQDTNDQNISEHLTHDVIHRRLVIESMLKSEEHRLKQLRQALGSKVSSPSHSHAQPPTNHMGRGGGPGAFGSNNPNEFNINHSHQQLMLEREREAAMNMANEEFRRNMLAAEINASAAAERESQEMALRQELALRASSQARANVSPAERLLDLVRSHGLDPRTMAPGPSAAAAEQQSREMALRQALALRASQGAGIAPGRPLEPPWIHGRDQRAAGQQSEEMALQRAMAHGPSAAGQQSQEMALQRAMALRASQGADISPERLLEAVRGHGLDPQTLTPGQLAQLMGMAGRG